MKHLKSLYVFHIVSETDSYTQAADKLHITHGAVSKQIKQLEAYLGTSLFVKQGRKNTLSEDGKTLKAHTNRAFETLATGVAQVTENRKNHLDVSCEPTLTMRWLMPRLNHFNKSNEVDVRLSTAGGPVSLESDDLCFAIRRDDFSIAKQYKTDTLVEEFIGPVCSPDYWKTLQGSSTAITLLHSQTRPNAWKDWMKKSQFTYAGSTEKYFDHFYFSLQAACDGLGMAMGSYPLIMDDLKSGRLLAPFGFISSDHGYVLIRASSQLTEQQQGFRHWLIEQMKHCIPIK